MEGFTEYARYGIGTKALLYDQWWADVDYRGYFSCDPAVTSLPVTYDKRKSPRCRVWCLSLTGVELDHGRGRRTAGGSYSRPATAR